MRIDNLSKDWLYFNLEVLNPVVRVNNNLKPTTKDRYDCTKFNVPNDNDRGFRFFKNSKGMIFLRRNESKPVIKCEEDRRAEFFLSGKSINFSSLYHKGDKLNFAFGNPSSREVLGKKHKKINPFFEYKKDLYLFIINDDYSKIEIIIIPEMKNYESTYYNGLINGEFDDSIKELRDKSIIFYDYGL